ncbi:MAG: glycosyltransferase family 4 protein, partial [Hyphomicrobiales bacterium]|nr:glycosyltransferase family 4 protein [Hyphomicrobiales bacterium]
GLEKSIAFAGAMPARAAFKLGRMMVVPSRAESLPYVVLEAAGAQIPLISTNVGGIPEIFGPYADRLIPSDDACILAERIAAMLARPPQEKAADASALADFVGKKFTLRNMGDAVIAGYEDALAHKRSAETGSAHPTIVKV